MDDKDKERLDIMSQAMGDRQQDQDKIREALQLSYELGYCQGTIDEIEKLKNLTFKVLQ